VVDWDCNALAVVVVLISGVRLAVQDFSLTVLTVPSRFLGLIDRATGDEHCAEPARGSGGGDTHPCNKFGVILHRVVNSASSPVHANALNHRSLLLLCGGPKLLTRFFKLACGEVVKVKGLDLLFKSVDPDLLELDGSLLNRRRLTVGNLPSRLHDIFIDRNDAVAVAVSRGSVGGLGRKAPYEFRKVLSQLPERHLGLSVVLVPNCRAGGEGSHEPVVADGQVVCRSVLAQREGDGILYPPIARLSDPCRVEPGEEANSVDDDLCPEPHDRRVVRRRNGCHLGVHSASRSGGEVVRAHGGAAGWDARPCRSGLVVSRPEERVRHLQLAILFVAQVLPGGQLVLSDARDSRPQATLRN